MRFFACAQNDDFALRMTKLDLRSYKKLDRLPRRAFALLAMTARRLMAMRKYALPNGGIIGRVGQ